MVYKNELNLFPFGNLKFVASNAGSLKIAARYSIILNVSFDIVFVHFTCNIDLIISAQTENVEVCGAVFSETQEKRLLTRTILHKIQRLLYCYRRICALFQVVLFYFRFILFLQSQLSRIFNKYTVIESALGISNSCLFVLAFLRGPALVAH